MVKKLLLAGSIGGVIGALYGTTMCHACFGTPSPGVPIAVGVISGLFIVGFARP
jgi:hypothetical protein